MALIKTKEDLQSIGIYGVQGVFDAQTTPNANLAKAYLQTIDPELIRTVTAPLTYNLIADNKFVGQFGTDSYRVNILEGSGEATEYSDYSNNGQVGLNLNTELRDAYRYEAGMVYGGLENEQNAMMGINIIREKREQAILTIQNRTNKIAFFGASGLTATPNALKNYGILNEPNLRALLSSAKTWTSTSKTFAEIIADINLMLNDIIVASQGLITTADKFKLAVPPAVYASLHLKLSNQDRSVFEVLKANLGVGGFEIVSAPELALLNATGAAATDGGKVILMALTGGRSPYEFLINERMSMSAIVNETTFSKQKMMASSFGTILKRPYAVSIMNNIIG